MSVQPWKHIICEIEQESDPDRIAELAQELNDAMLAEQKEKVRRRLGLSAQNMEETFAEPFDFFVHRGGDSRGSRLCRQTHR